MKRINEREKKFAANNIGLLMNTHFEYCRRYRITEKQDKEDLYSEMSSGYMNCVKLYDKSVGPFSTYVYNAMYNCFKEFLRCRTRRKDIFFTSAIRDEESLADCKYCSLSNNTYETDVFGELKVYVKKFLKKKDFDILYKKYFLGMSVAQIAKVHKCTKPKIYKTIKKSLDVVRFKLNVMNLSDDDFLESVNV